MLRYRRENNNYRAAHNRDLRCREKGGQRDSARAKRSGKRRNGVIIGGASSRATRHGAAGINLCACQAPGRRVETRTEGGSGSDGKITTFRWKSWLREFRPSRLVQDRRRAIYVRSTYAFAVIPYEDIVGF